MECRTVTTKVNLYIYDKYYPLKLKKIRDCKFGDLLFFIFSTPSEQENTLWRA